MDLERERYVDWKGRSMASRKHNENGGATIVCCKYIFASLLSVLHLLYANLFYIAYVGKINLYNSGRFMKILS